MDFELTDEQVLVRDTARDFSEREIAPRARDNSRNEHFDLDLVAKIAAQGYLGAIVPREYGGAGLDYLTYGLIVEHVGRACSAMRTVVSVQTSLVCSVIVKFGTEDQKHHWLPPALLRRHPRVLRPDRARHRVRRRQPEDARHEGRRRLAAQRLEDVDQQRQRREARAHLRPDGPRARPQGHRLLPRRHRPGRLRAQPDPREDGHARRRHRLHRARRRLRPGGPDARRGRPGLQDRDDVAGLRPLLRRRRLRRHLSGKPGRVGQVRQGTSSSSAARSRPSSWCRR